MQVLEVPNRKLLILFLKNDGRHFSAEFKNILNKTSRIFEEFNVSSVNSKQMILLPKMTHRLPSTT